MEFFNGHFINKPRIGKQQYNGEKHRTFQFKNGDIYEGPGIVHNGNFYPSGTGKLIYANGDVFNGEIYNMGNEYNGTIFYANGDTFQGLYIKGDFYDGHFNKAEDGTNYEGTLNIHKERHGYGFLTEPDGTFNAGMYLNDVPIETHTIVRNNSEEHVDTGRNFAGTNKKLSRKKGGKSNRRKTKSNKK